MPIHPEPGSVQDRDPHLAQAIFTAKSYIDAWLAGIVTAPDLPTADALDLTADGQWGLAVERTPRVGHAKATTVTFAKVRSSAKPEGWTDAEIDTDTPCVRLYLKRRRRGGWRVQKAEQVSHA
jgi:hypothetical protein